MLKEHKKRRIVIAGLGAVLSVGLIGGALAYMSDTDAGINILKVGNVQITASEPHFPTEDGNNNGVPDDCELLIPHATIPKDPRIKNVGVNDAVVFFKVISPAEQLTEITDDGVRQPEKENDLFWFKQEDDEETAHANNFNPDWIQLTSAAENETIVDFPGVNDEGRGKVYIFGYHTRIEPEETTETLFDKVQNKKYGSKTIGPNEVETIHIESYAIQADEIRRAGINVDTNAEISEQDLAYIYNTFCNQNSENLK